MIVGSLVWRLVNYGPLPTFKYLINHFSQNQFVGVKNATLIKTCHDLDDFLELPPGVSNSEIELIRTQINNYESNLRIEFPHIKIKEIFGPNLSINRLLIIRLLIKTGNYNHFIETGTQFGLSAFIANESKRNLKNRFSILSLDVCKSFFLPCEEVIYQLLKWPVRRNFEKIFPLYRLQDSIIFFHDSDHSYENMTYEFNLVWGFTNIRCLISDDVENNNAFNLFCERNNLTPILLKIDKGPTVGFILR